MSPVRVPSNLEDTEALENGAKHFTKEEWDALTPAEKARFKEIMQNNLMHVILETYLSKIKTYLQVIAGSPAAVAANTPPKAKLGKDQKKP